MTTQQIIADLEPVIGALSGDAAQTVGAAYAELKRLLGLINSPHTEEFLGAVRIEAAHQVLRWGDDHDRSKSAENWLFLVGYLGSKACRAQIEGDREKALHHTISSAAALMHWHSFIKNDDTCIGLGMDEDLEAICERFGFGPQSVYRVFSVASKGEEPTEYYVARNSSELFGWLHENGPLSVDTQLREVALNEHVLAGPGTERECSLLEAMTARLLGGDTPPFHLVGRQPETQQ